MVAITLLPSLITSTSSATCNSIISSKFPHSGSHPSHNITFQRNYTHGSQADYKIVRCSFQRKPSSRINQNVIDENDDPF